ncbi:hypothetical protein [Paenibacillus fonticola]|uniref:hypothetical protein n=1 Tax=Paenibacillus fonticola TaxID=379896 RepID=UPI0012F7701A
MDRQAGKSVVGTINNRAGTARIGGCDLTWKAGQYGLFSITHKSVKNGTRPFSVSSAPTENAVRITTRIGEQPSEFKKALLELTPNMKITMRCPAGPFHLQDENPALFIAGRNRHYPVSVDPQANRFNTEGSRKADPSSLYGWE